ncbi:DUF2291 family protein [Rouxiella chamberiensis]|uniref:DUF2291 family protein n=1 Tax=Rouxiella chamberiensis TaxID=1513468 RepID=A0ABY7HU31_9GAMM|nr:DUF2291 family protein [Rouxiella chamberiensis]WAT02477.1 DUF2291 family protein [Rouxiella chamberiensis]
MVTRPLFAGVLTAAVLLVGCTVVDLDSNGQPIIPKDPLAKASFSNQTPQQVTEENWDSKVVKGAQERALSWADMKTKSTTLKAGTSESVFVRAGGTVTAVSAATERERQITVTINGESVPVMIGPVVRSNAIRDAAGFKFEDFTNQVQFAQLTKALNRHAVKQLPAVDNGWIGKPVQLVLAVSMVPNQVQDVVAISLKQEQP